jgi:single-strand DNA-binding protein
MYNKIAVIGRCTADPTLRYTPAGHATCIFTLAVDRARKDAQGNKTTDFFMVETWRGLAENCANFLSKGKLALADGEAHIDKWEKDGEKHQAFKIAADTVRFLSPKERESSSNPSQEQGNSSKFGHEVSFDDSSDIPF